MEPKLSEKQDIWYIEAFCNSNYSGDKDTQISVSGYIIYLMGSPVAWRSQSQKSVTLSSTEAEYISITEVITEIMFIKQVLEFLGLEIEYPIIVRVDNVGAIYLANNMTTRKRTKHMDIHYHYVREFIEDGILKIIFVRSEENDSDIYTKNVSGKLFEKHTDKYMKDIEE